MKCRVVVDNNMCQNEAIGVYMIRTKEVLMPTLNIKAYVELCGYHKRCLIKEK